MNQTREDGELGSGRLANSLLYFCHGKNNENRGVNDGLKIHFGGKNHKKL